MAAPVTPIRQRTQYTCGAASLSMALKALGVTLCGEDKVNEVMGAAPMQGASWEQIAAAANHYGCRSTLVVPSTLAQVKGWTDAGKPVLIGWNPEDRPWSHASLVFDVTDTTVFVADPNCPDPAQTVREVPIADFYKKWSEEWNGYKVRRPAMLIDREVDSEGRQVMASTRQATTLTQPLSLRYDYGYKKDLTMNTSRLPEDVAITASGDPWKDTAKKLLDARKGTGQDDLHYRAYLRAIISGQNPSHLSKQFEGAKEAMRDLIDERGKLKTASEHDADSDGSYMSVGYLKALADKSKHLLDYISYDTPMPDWAEAKIGQAANAINSVHDYFVYRGDEGGEMKLEDQYTLLPQAVTAKFEEGKSVDVPKYLEEHGNPEAAKEWVEQNEANRDKFKTATSKVAVGDIPADVERYVKEIEKSNPDYDEAQTWATAWSIYCKYKNPGSDHCTMPASDYFAGRSAADEGLEAAWGETMADWSEGHVITPAVSGPDTPFTEEWGSDTPDGFGNIAKRARVLSKQESFARMDELEKKHGRWTKEWYDAVIKEVKEGVIAPAAVVGGGYKDGKAVALKWLTSQKASKTAASNGKSNSDFLNKIDAGAKDKILKNIAKHYDISPKEALAEVTDAEAESLLDYMVEPERSAAAALMKKYKSASADAEVAAILAEMDLEAKFEKGKPADPTENMSPADAAEWNKQKEEHKDQFKAARQRLSWDRSAGLDEACWEGYEAVGMKELDGKQVPNCVPKQASVPSTVQGWLEWED